MKEIDETYFYNNPDPMKKNALEDVLLEDERILLKLKPNKKAFMWESFFAKGLPMVLLWAGFDGLFLYLIFSGTLPIEEAMPFFIPMIIIFFALHLLPVWLFIAGAIKRVAGYKNIEYAFTNKRILIRTGLVGIDFKSIYYSEITGVNVRVGILDRLFRVGDIYITAKDQRAVIDDINNPYFYMSKIQEISHDIKTDIEFPNAYRPSENPGYHTNYKDK